MQICGANVTGYTLTTHTKCWSRGRGGGRRAGSTENKNTQASGGNKAHRSTHTYFIHNTTSATHHGRPDQAICRYSSTCPSCSWSNHLSASALKNVPLTSDPSSSSRSTEKSFPSPRALLQVRMSDFLVSLRRELFRRELFRRVLFRSERERLDSYRRC